MGVIIMAAIVPLTALEPGYLSPRMNRFLLDPAGDVPLSDAHTFRSGAGSLRHLTFYFSDADNTDLFPTPPGTLAVAWQPRLTDNRTTATIGSTGIIFTGVANSKGWLHCLCRGTLKTGSTTTDAPVARGTAGHVQPERSMYLSHRAATVSVDNLVSGKHIGNKAALRLRIFPFLCGSSSDTWANESGGLCPGIVAVAWQANDAAEDITVTQAASGDVEFISTAGTVEVGWLWAWSR